MDKDRSGREVLALAAGALLLTFAHASIAQTLRLEPNGVDDTDQLQAALDTCQGAVPACRIVLGSGTFYSRLLVVDDFRGRISGQGVGVTIVSPVLGRQLRPALRPFAQPASRAAPYPVLLHFANGGNIELLDFTLDFPPQMQVARWRDGSNDMWNVLLSAVMVDGAGQHRARLYVERMEVLASECRKVADLLSNVMSAFTFGGQERWISETADTIPTPLGSGQFTVRSTYVRNAGIGFRMHDALRVDMAIENNDLQHTRAMAVSVFETGGSRVRIVDNRIAGEGTVIRTQRGARLARDPAAAPPSLIPTVYLIARNVVNLGVPRPGYAPFGVEAISVEDVTYANAPARAGIDSVMIEGNDITLEGNGRAISVAGDRRGRAMIQGNHVFGPALFTGIGIDQSVGTRTRNNRFDGFAPGSIDLYLSIFTQQCVVVEPGATVRDDGVDNIVVAETVQRSAAASGPD